MSIVNTTAGPYFEDLRVGQAFDGAPAMTLTEGRAAAHQAITGDRLRLPLDGELCRRVTGSTAPLAHPALVWDVAIGQSTLVTQHVIANLFYRGLVFARAPRIGDTLTTRTTVVALRQSRPRPQRPATGLATLRITTADQHDRPVLDFRRCAMLPLRDPEQRTGHADDPEADGGQLEVPLSAAVDGWSLGAFADAVPGPHADAVTPGTVIDVGGGDVVSSAPELARLTLNVAAVHHDAAAAGHRLVYGGHTIGLALSQATRALPNLVTVTGWHGCDHTGPVREGDTLTSRVEVTQVEPLPGGTGALARLRSTVRATAGPGCDPRDVLDWRYAAVLA